jgi:hypothetical protein
VLPVHLKEVSMRLRRTAFTFLVSLLLLQLPVGASEGGKPLRVSDLPASARAGIIHALARNAPAELTGSDAGDSGLFAWSVAISGSTVAVGAPIATVNGVSVAGAVYVFVKPASGWENMTQVAKLTASDGVPMELGYSVAIYNNTIVAGCNSNVAQYPAYVFVKPPSGWADMTQTAELSPTDGSNSDVFGNSVAVSGNTIVVGSNMGAYVYMRPAGGWTNATQTAKLTNVAMEDFGLSVAINGNTIVVGAPGANQGLGSAYVFGEPAGGWTNTSVYEAELTASDAAANSQFGISVAISGDTVVVGSPQALGTGESPPGAVYVYVEPAGGWISNTETAELTVANEPTEELGYSVGISGRAIVAGAPDGKGAKGLAYVFTELAGGWVTTSEYTSRLSAGSGTNEVLGFSMAISGATVVAGAPGAAVGSDGEEGAAFVFVLGP